MCIEKLDLTTKRLATCTQQAAEERERNERLVKEARKLSSNLESGKMKDKDLDAKFQECKSKYSVAERALSEVCCMEIRASVTAVCMYV